AEDGIRDFHVTGVQTCALPICVLIDGVGADRQPILIVFAPFAEGVVKRRGGARQAGQGDQNGSEAQFREHRLTLYVAPRRSSVRSEERRVGKEWRSEERASRLK